MSGWSGYNPMPFPGVGMPVSCQCWAGEGGMVTEGNVGNNDRNCLGWERILRQRLQIRVVAQLPSGLQAPVRGT